MAAGRVTYAEYDGVQALRLIGEIRYTLGPSLDRFLKKMCSGPAPRGVVIDLTDADCLDSTTLGLLARVAKWLQRVGGPRATMVSTKEDINDLLYNVGFDEVFDISESAVDEAAQADTHQLEQAGEAAELKSTILEAHRTLMTLNLRNRDEFQDVVKLLEQDAKPAPED